jgi:hypothetical protein
VLFGVALFLFAVCLVIFFFIQSSAEQMAANGEDESAKSEAIGKTSQIE